MFDIFGSGPPEGWEPIPDEVRDELGPWDDEDIPAGMVPVTTGPDDFVWEAVGRQVGVETLALLQATPLDELSQQGLVTALRRSDDLIAHVEAIKTDVTVRLAGREPATEAERRDDYTPLEIGAATRCSAQAADVKILVAGSSPPATPLRCERCAMAGSACPRPGI